MPFWIESQDCTCDPAQRADRGVVSYRGSTFCKWCRRRVEPHAVNATSMSGMTRKWTRTGHSYPHAVADGSVAPPPTPPGVSMMMLLDEPTEDRASQVFFSEFANWYGSSYLCRTCRSSLYKTVFPKGHEFEIFTDDQAHPRIAVKRVFSCAQCQRFVTSAASEDDVYPFSVEAMRDGKIAAGGNLGEPNNFEYECGSVSEYRKIVVAANVAGTTAGRDGAGFIKLGAGDPSSTSPANGRDKSRDVEKMLALGMAAHDVGDRGTARTWFSRAAELGDTSAMRYLTFLAAQDGDRVTALAWLRRAADHGEADAMYELAKIAHGAGDLASARNYYWRSAHLGSAAAMNDFGWLADKEGDRATALAWYGRAADRGDTAAMYALGALALAEGDRPTALTWLRRATALGDPAARGALQSLGEPAT